MRKIVHLTIYKDVDIEIIGEKKCLESYIRCINSNATMNDIFERAAYYSGETPFIEGIGRENEDYIVHEIDEDMEVLDFEDVK